MTLLFKIEVQIEGDPAELSKKYSGQIADFKKIHDLCKKHGGDFIDSGIDAPNILHLLIQRENETVKTFQEVIDRDLKKAFTNKEVYSLINPEYNATNIKQELIGMYK